MNWTLYLPFATTVHVYGYTNAGFNQQIVVTPESGPTLTLTGSGEGNTPTNPPSATITTPATGGHVNGFQVQVSISAWKNGGWSASQLAGAGCSLGISAATYLVCSEDLVDNDWNDAVVQFFWYNPPAVAAAARTAMASHLEAHS